MTLYSRFARTSVCRLALAAAMAGLVLAAGCRSDAVSSKQTATEAVSERPQFKLTTSQKFPIESIERYGASHRDIYDHIDYHLDSHIGALQRWVRQKSISAQSDGIQEMASLFASDLKRAGFKEVQIVPTDGHPGVWGYLDAGAPRTLAVYMMYDVQPVVPAEWRSPPFDAALIDNEYGTVLMGRGASNQKGPERAFLNAVESVLAVRGSLPVNLMVLAEGEEEVGSKHYADLIARFESRLRTAQGAFMPHNAQETDGTVQLSLGVKGFLYFELEAHGGDRGGPRSGAVHGLNAAWMDSPVWRLVQALGSLTSPDGNTILVKDYYQGIRPPTQTEQQLINSMLETWSVESVLKQNDVKQLVGGKTGADALLDLLYLPTLNIDGIWGGYTGNGGMNILPHKATAKLDSRLPADMSPQLAIERIRRHLDAKGFQDVEMRVMESYPSSQTDINSEVVHALLSVTRKHSDIRPRVVPRLAGSAPFYVFTDKLHLPFIPGGIGFGSGAHAPNEFMVIRPKAGSKLAGLAEIEKAYVDFLFAFADQKPANTH